MGALQTQINRERQTDRHRQTDRQTYRQTDRQTDRQTETQRENSNSNTCVLILHKRSRFVLFQLSLYDQPHSNYYYY